MNSPKKKKKKEINYGLEEENYENDLDKEINRSKSLRAIN